MTQPESILIVLVDADDVKSVFATWPDDICLAVCLTREGACSMIVFRREERPDVPERLVLQLGVSHRDVCFVPRVPGFATRSFLYSEERRLMALVASDPAVLEEAIDYAVNVTYALEEGLDPAQLLGLPPLPRESRSRGSDVSPPVDPVQRASHTRALGELNPLLPDFLRRSAEASRRPRFASVRKSRVSSMLAQT